MLASIKTLTLIIMLAPMLGAISVGIFGKMLGRVNSHRVTILLMTVSLVCALINFNHLVLNHGLAKHFYLYEWGVLGSVHFTLGLLVDHLTAMMMVIVTFVSLFVHIYSVGYMSDDDGYQRFFSYMSLFTFAMLCLVAANDFVMLFFGWEGVGLVSYLLIGFWYKKETSGAGALKAFVVNRVGDMGFILAIAAVFSYFGTVEYGPVFQQVASLTNVTISIIPGLDWSVLTVICLLLFVGAAGKSAQVPLHVWLPESMEGPTPISALIHAATMVTAGVFMICRMSPIFEYSTTALSVVLVLGSITCLFMGLLAVVQHDLKRVIAYSTLSQLGYMMIGVGSSAYAAGMFHLFTHACFKALLFLAAGSVIIAMHHEQDMRKMGNLWRYMPITWLTFLIGGLALAAIPPFSGFYSKDSIIEAAHASVIFGSNFAYICALLGAFVTALYIFRAFFLTFHGQENIPTQLKKSVCESRFVVTLPLMVLAIPSIFLGFIAIKPLLYDNPSAFGSAITILPEHNTIAALSPEFHGALSMTLHAWVTWPFWFALLGVITAFVFTIFKPEWADRLKDRFSFIYKILIAKYGFDDFNQRVFVCGTRYIGDVFYRIGDMLLIDRWMVNGSGRLIAWLSARLRLLQTGYVNHYAVSMVLGLFMLLIWVVIGMKL